MKINRKLSAVKDGALVDCDKRHVGKWDGKSVKRLFSMMKRAMSQYDSAFCSADIPCQAQIPDDLTELPSDAFVWACDVGGKCLVNLEDGGGFEIIHANALRGYLAYIS